MSDFSRMAGEPAFLRECERGPGGAEGIAAMNRMGLLPGTILWGRGLISGLWVTIHSAVLCVRYADSTADGMGGVDAMCMPCACHVDGGDAGDGCSLTAE
jgi:hypothetical protein